MLLKQTDWCFYFKVETRTLRIKTCK